MATTVDSLDIQISAESKKASVAIDNLVKKLDRVSASLSGVNTRGLATMASGVNKLSNAMANFSKNTKTADFSRITRNLNKLGEINPNSIAVASKSLGKIAGAMKAFDSINVSDNAAKLAELSKGISTLGYKSAEKALDNIPKLATAMKSFMKTLSTAPKVSQNIIDMTNAMARFARTGASGGKAANELANSMSNMSRKFASIPSVFKKVNVTMSSSVLSLKNLKQALSSVIGTFGGIYAVFEGLKKSIDISSDLTEAQNVIDVTFGKYSKAIEDFTKVSIKDFGMSELTAKTMAGRFQAMGTAIGFSQKKMSGMSVELTKLAADMASFYNVEQDAVATSLQSVFTGETEPLRKYGLDLTQATLEEWAHKQGIDAKMKSMSQAEKTMLRYQYVMANTAAAQGDFARTANTWANQIRLLKQNFEVLGSTVGGVLINALKPFVQGLNVIMGQINDFAKIISNALGKIFGWTYEESGGATNPAEEMASGMDDVADYTDKATKAQKEYNRQLGKFDELNNYNKQKNNDTTGGDGTGNGVTMPSSAGTSTGKWTQGKSIIKEYESEIDSLYELGETIGDALKTAMKRIDWDGIYKKAKNFGTGLASFLNGLISPGLFDELGKTVAGTLNTALHFLDSFGKTFEWKNFGKSLSEGLKGYFGTFDWKLSTDTFNTLANGILDSIIAGLENIGKKDWEKVGQTIADMISGIDAKGITFKVGKIANELANAFYLLVSNKDIWKNLGTKIADGINGFFEGMSEVDEDTGLTGWQALGKSISDTITGLGDSIIIALNEIDWKLIGQSIADFIGSIDWEKINWTLNKIIDSLELAIKDTIEGATGIEVSVHAIDIALKFSAISWILKKITGNSILKYIKDSIIKLLTSAGVLKAGKLSLSISSIKNLLLSLASGLSVAIPSPLTDDFIRNIEMWFTNKVVKKVPLLKAASALWSGFVNTIIDVLDTAGNIIVNSFKDALDISDFKLTGNDMADGFIKGFTSALVFPATLINNLILKPIKKALGIHSPSKKFKEIGKNCIDGLMNGLKTLKDLAEDFGKKIIKWFPDKIISIGAEIATKWSDIKDGWNKLISPVKDITAEFKAKIATKWSDIKDGWQNLTKNIKDKVAEFKGKVSTKWGDLKDKWQNLTKNIKDKVVDFKAKIATKWSDIKDKWKNLTNPIKDINAKITATFNDAFTNPLKYAWNSIAKTINGAINTINKLPGVNIGAKLPTLYKGGIFCGNSIKDITKYASGGFPNMGQMFIAREKGPELVGNLGGHTAVMNNDQIVSSVSDGVYHAVLAAMSNFSYNNGNNQGDIIIQIDGKEVFRAVRNEDIDFKRRTGKSAFSY